MKVRAQYLVEAWIFDKKQGYERSVARVHLASKTKEKALKEAEGITPQFSNSSDIVRVTLECLAEPMEFDTLYLKDGYKDPFK